MKTLFALLLLALASPLAFADVQSIDLTDRLVSRNQLNKETRWLKPYLFDADFRYRLKRWLNHPSNFTYVTKCQDTLRPYFTNQKIVGAACYLLRQDPAGQDNRISPHNAFWILRRYLLEVRAAASEIASVSDWTVQGDGRYDYSKRMQANSLAQVFSDAWIEGMWASCIAPFASLDRYAKDQQSQLFSLASGGLFGGASFEQMGGCLKQAFAKPYEAPIYLFPKVDIPNPNAAKSVLSFFEAYGPHPGHAISETGWIGGNKVEYLVNAVTDPKYLDQLKSLYGGTPRFKLVEKFYTVALPKQLPLARYTGSVNTFRAKAKLDPKSWWKREFTEAQGFWPLAKHPIWTAEGSMFREMVGAIDRAHETIYINIFFLGGTMGAAMAKHLIERAESGVKVFLMHDNFNDFGFRPQMEPVFNYLWAYALENPSKMLVAPSKITGHPSGLPAMLERVVTDGFIKAVGLTRHLNLYARAVSDHSKVMVVDGKVAPETFRADGSRVYPTAFVGSKNWTDSSGALCFDEVFKIQGPGAAVVLDDYYLDMREALLDSSTIGPRQQFGAIEAGVVNRVAREGWSRDLVTGSETREELVAKILRPFDLLDRDGNLTPADGARAVVAIDMPQGAGDPEWDTVLRTGMNNWDSTRTNTVDQVIQAILFAKSKILIKDQFLFDRNVISALVRKKRENPSLDIRVILEPLLETGTPGMPNILYLDYLQSAGIGVRFAAKRIHDPEIAQEFHPKTVSVDGRYLISGSANKDMTTMYGSFREEQIEAWDPRATAVHDHQFEQMWSSQSYPFRGYGPRAGTDASLGHAEPGQFDPPAQLVGLDGKPLNTKQFVEFLRNVLALVYDATEL